MRIAEINMFSYGSTGKIMLQIAECARQAGAEVYTYSTHTFSYKYKKLPKASKGHKYFGNFFENSIHYFLSRVVGFNGCFSTVGTYFLIKELKKLKIDILHLHNLHNYCINIPLLFHYIKKSRIRVIWTLHDCWTFTGHCPHFSMIKCNKWRESCFQCLQHNHYPASYFDDSKYMYKLKKKWFTGVENMTLVTPSQWLSELVNQSFLKEYPVQIINNGIDLSIFKPRNSDFRKNIQCENKFIVLGVAHSWNERKGLDVFIELAGRLEEKYQIVLVGTNENVDKKLPDNIISIHRTHNQIELAEIYTAADVFLNPTREEVFGLVNIEALACGTPVLTFDTGGSPECIDETCGKVVAKDDMIALEHEIREITQNSPYSVASCVNRAKQYDMNRMFKEYVNLYENSVC